MNELDILNEALYALERGKIDEAYQLLDLCYSPYADRACEELIKGQDDSAAIAASWVRTAIEDLEGNL